ncbi:MAG: hypothetical protein MHPSP_002027, partial [Paramarteilia canceri]
GNNFIDYLSNILSNQSLDELSSIELELIGIRDQSDKDGNRWENSVSLPNTLNFYNNSATSASSLHHPQITELSYEILEGFQTYKYLGLLKLSDRSFDPKSLGKVCDVVYDRMEAICNFRLNARNFF